MLTSCHLVVGGLDFKAHLLQRKAYFSAGALTVVQGAKIKIPGFIVGLGGRLAFLIGLEKEKLALGTNIKGVIAHGYRFLQRAYQDTAGIAHKRSSVRIIDIADETRHLAVLRTPGENHKGIQIRVKILIGLLNAHKPLDG
ncbi:hypothetical protein SDC9_47941 [bioreactor metagenome]|uniref:Uncharacterized protein n=1 Tax=bioreactor metagenome TaxID=1076179 RepID=A0A644WE09_9ZZZZ